MPINLVGNENPFQEFKARFFGMRWVRIWWRSTNPLVGLATFTLGLYDKGWENRHPPPPPPSWITISKGWVESRITFCTTRNFVVCNPSLSDYVQPNVTCDYKWLPMQLFLKFGWSLVFFSTRLRLWLISSFNFFKKLMFCIFYNIVYTFNCKCNQDNHMLVI
jgi:hypothetical protein